jgi:hypothetical protein
VIVVAVPQNIFLADIQVALGDAVKVDVSSAVEKNWQYTVVSSGDVRVE